VLLRDYHKSFQGSSHRARHTHVPPEKKKETAMKQSRAIEVTHPTLRSAPRRMRMTLTNALTLGAVLMAIALSVTLSAAANTDVCARPIDTTISAPCDYR
jgi:hypothetical protein